MIHLSCINKKRKCYLDPKPSATGFSGSNVVDIENLAKWPAKEVDSMLHAAEQLEPIFGAGSELQTAASCTFAEIATHSLN